MTRPDCLLHVHDLGVGPAHAPLLHALDMCVSHGAWVALAGANGVGKTTLTRCVAGITRPAHGSILLSGHPVTPDNPASRAAIGLAVAHWLIPGELTGRECVDLFAQAYAVDTVEETLDTLDSLGLDRTLLRAEVQTYSLGTRQKLGLALGLSGKPQLILLDEALGGLDAASLIATEALLRQRCAQGAAVLMVTHAIEYAARVADRLMLLHAGHIAGTWSREDLERQRRQGSDVLAIVAAAQQRDTQQTVKD